MLSRKVLLLSIGFLLFLWIGIVVLSSLKRQQPTNPTQFPTPTVVPAPGFSYKELENMQLSVFQKASIEQTTDQQVAQLSGLENSKRQDNGTTKYTFTSVNPLIPDEIITQNGRVIFERTSTFTSETGGLPNISDFTKQFGTPEKTINGNTFYGPSGSALLFPQKGVALIGNTTTDEVYEIQHFTPMSVDTYMRLYGSYVTPVQSVEEGQ